METFAVTVEMSAVKLSKTLGFRPPAVAKKNKQGMVSLPNEVLADAYRSLKDKLTVLPEGNSFTVELTKDEQAALFYEVTAHRVGVTHTGLEVTGFNFPVIVGLIQSGFLFPDQDKFYR